MFGFVIVVTAACGSSHDDVSSLAENRSHRMIGTQKSGGYDFSGDSYTFFAGDFKGDFRSTDCREAAENIKDQHKEARVSHRFNTPERITLDHRNRHLVLGYRNNTEGKWAWFCVQIDPTGHSTKYFSNRWTGYRTSGEWVKEKINFNGTLVQIQFADMDAFGELAYVFRYPD
jgi:hypothetical protein